MVGMFSYKQNVERLAQMEEGLAKLNRKARRTDEDEQEREHLRDAIAEMEAWFRAVDR